MLTEQWQSVADDGSTTLVIVQHNHGLVLITDELLADLMKRSGIHQLAAIGRTPDLPGVNFLPLADMGRLMSGAGMRKLS